MSLFFVGEINRKIQVRPEKPLERTFHCIGNIVPNTKDQLLSRYYRADNPV